MSTPIGWKPIKVDDGGFSPVFRVVLGAQSVLHARAVRVKKAARTVDHVCVNKFVESGLGNGIRDFSGDYFVNMRWRFWLILLLDYQEDMCMR